MADLRISQLPALAGAVLQSDDALAIVDLSASETKKLTAKDLIQSGVALIDAGSIPGDKVNVTLAPGSVGTTELADKSVTAAKLADSSTAVLGGSLPPAGAYIGQLGVTTPSNEVSIWNGSVWTPFATGLISITGGTVGSVSTVVTTVGNQASVLAQVDDSTVPAAFLAGPTASAGAVELRPIIPADLPIAGVGTAGIVTVPDGGGLRIDGGDSGLGSDLVIDNDLPSNAAFGVVTYSEKGLVTGGRLIESADLPLATNSTPGVIAAGSEFTVQPGGFLQLANQITGGSHPYVTYNDQGMITSGRDLTAADIPDLDASKITGGTLPTDRLADKSVTKAKLGDYSIAYIQEAQPTITGEDHVGILWYQESTAQLRMWNSNSFMPVGFGRLSNENLRWGGLVDATTGLVTGVTAAGQTAGLTIGQAPPEATDSLGGLYLLVSVGGNNIAVTPGIGYDAGDWCLCINEAEGWIRIDTLSGGGGGGASTLDDLLDVTIAAATTGQYLQLQTNGQWQNVDLTIPEQGVQSVNGDTGPAVVLDAADVGALPDDTPLDFVPLGSWAALPGL